MDRKSKAASVRLSGIFDLFSEAKTGLECQKGSSDEQQNQLKELTAGKKKSLFSLRRRKAASDSKVDEKCKGKSISWLEQTPSACKPEQTPSVRKPGQAPSACRPEQTSAVHKPEQTPSVCKPGQTLSVSKNTQPEDDDGDQDETTDVSHTVVLRRTGEVLTLNEIKSRSGPILARDFTLNPTVMRDEGGTASENRLFEGINVKQKAIVESRNSQSGDELSQTQKKNFNMVNKRPKLFRFPSRNKSKLLDDVDAKLSESETLFRQHDRSKSTFLDWGEVQVDKHLSQSKTMAESEDGKSKNCHELSIGNRQTIVLAKDLPGSWKDFRFVRGEDQHCKTEARSLGNIGDSKLHQHNKKSNNDDTKFSSKCRIDVLKRLTRNFVCSPLYLVRGLYISIKSLLILIYTLVIFLLYKIYVYLKYFMNFLINSFSMGFLIVKGLLKSMGQLIPVTRTTQKKVTVGKHDNDSEISKCEYVNKHNHTVSELIKAGKNVNPNGTNDNFYSLPNTGTALLAKASGDADKNKRKWWKILCHSSKSEKNKNGSCKSVSDVSDEVIIAKENSSLCIGQSKHSEDEIRKLDNAANSNIAILLCCLKKIFHLPLFIILFVPVNMIRLLKCVYSKMFTTVTTNSVKPEIILSGDTRITELQHPEELKHSKELREKRDKSKIKSSFFDAFCSTKRQKSKSEPTEFDADEYSVSDYEYSQSSSELEQTPSINKAPLTVCNSKVISRNKITCFESICTNICSCVQTVFCFAAQLVFTLLTSIKVVLQFIVMLPYFVILLFGKVIMFIVQCCYYVIAGVGKLVMFMAKLMCFVFLLISSLPLGTFAFLRFSVRFVAKICLRCYMCIIRKVRCKSTLDVHGEDENDACDDTCRFSDLSNDTEYKAKEKIQRNWGVSSLLKKPKKISKKVVSYQGQSQEFSGSESDELETKSGITLSKFRCGVRKLKEFTLELFLKLISIILLLPLVMFSILSFIFNFLGCLFATASERVRGFVMPIWTPADGYIDDFPDSSKKINKGKKIKFFRQLSKPDEKGEKRSSLNSTEEGPVDSMKPSPGSHVVKQYESESENDSSLERCSDSEETDPEKMQRKCLCPPGTPLARLKMFLKVFFHLQSIFFSALWNRINIAISSLCKMTLLAMLRLTPKTIVKWTLILVCRYTPGIRNRAILLQFLKDTPAQVTKSLSEAYLRRVSIPVMMVHAEMSLRDSPTKRVVRLASATWTSVTRLFEKFFLGVSSFFKELSRAFKIKRKKKRTILKDKILLRLSSSERSGND